MRVYSRKLLSKPYTSRCFMISGVLKVEYHALRRAWIELNYIYFYIIEKIEKMSFELFMTEATWFLSKEEDIRKQIGRVNLCDLRLSDMGNTTLGITAPPYDEIAQEAFSVWELFEGKYR